MLFSYGSGQQQMDGNKKCRQIAGSFDCQVNEAVQRGAHLPMEHIQGITGCRHWSSACAVSPRQPPWSKNSNQTHTKLTKHNFYLATMVHFDR